MRTLVLVRHGESVWNSEGLFTGWVDVGLSPKGVDEAVNCGRLLDEAGLRPDVVHTSVLTRAIQTAHLALESADLLWLPVRRSWRLNERHYGALQGKNKAQTRQQLKDVAWRLLPYWHDAIIPDLAAGGTVLVVAHGNSIRALVKHLDEIGDAEIAGLDIPTGMPLIYELDAGFRPETRGGRYLDPAAAAEGAAAVKSQGR